VSVTETLGSPSLSVAGLAVDFFVGPVARQHGIQRAFAVVAAEAQFVVLLYVHGYMVISSSSLGY